MDSRQMAENIKGDFLGQLDDFVQKTHQTYLLCRQRHSGATLLTQNQFRDSVRRRIEEFCDCLRPLNKPNDCGYVHDDGILLVYRYSRDESGTYYLETFIDFTPAATSCRTRSIPPDTAHEQQLREAKQSLNNALDLLAAQAKATGTIIKGVTVEKPTYQHSCSGCTFLGSYRPADDGLYDLYYCPQGHIPTVLARYGDSGPSYVSGMDSPIPTLQEAQKRAVQRGFDTGQGLKLGRVVEYLKSRTKEVRAAWDDLQRGNPHGPATTNELEAMAGMEASAEEVENLARLLGLNIELELRKAPNERRPI